MPLRAQVVALTVCLTCIAAGVTHSQTAASQNLHSAYDTALKRYVSGDFEGAVHSLLKQAWTDADFGFARAYWSQRLQPRSRQVGALLHLEVGLGSANAPPEALTSRHLRLAADLASGTPGPFRRLFVLTRTSLFHAYLFLPDAHIILHDLMADFPDDAEVLLAHAAVLETFLTPLARDVRRPSELRHPTPLIVVANALRSVVDRDPGLAEARVRLALVLVRLDRPRDALRELGHPETSSAAPFVRYLHHLALGLAHERIREFEQATQSYRSAGALYPEAQTPLIALMHLLQREGNRAGASGAFDEWARRPARTQHPDPWWEYWHGQFWMLEERIGKLRALAAEAQ